MHKHAKLGQENLLRILRWIRWHCPPDTYFKIRAMSFCDRVLYLSATEATQNTESLWVSEKEKFCSAVLDRQLQKYNSFSVLFYGTFLMRYTFYSNKSYRQGLIWKLGEHAFPLTWWMADMTGHGGHVEDWWIWQFWQTLYKFKTIICLMKWKITTLMPSARSKCE